jgi:hypothetical protein
LGGWWEFIKGSLLKVREEKYKGEPGGAQVETEAKNPFLLFRCLWEGEDQVILIQ